MYSIINTSCHQRGTHDNILGFTGAIGGTQWGHYSRLGLNLEKNAFKQSLAHSQALGKEGLVFTFCTWVDSAGVGGFKLNNIGSLLACAYSDELRS